jgi:hypothetical protein
MMNMPIVTNPLVMRKNRPYVSLCDKSTMILSRSRFYLW